jgi:hypothetical protein
LQKEFHLFRFSFSLNLFSLLIWKYHDENIDSTFLLLQKIELYNLNTKLFNWLDSFCFVLFFLFLFNYYIWILILYYFIDLVNNNKRLFTSLIPINMKNYIFFGLNFLIKKKNKIYSRTHCMLMIILIWLITTAFSWVFNKKFVFANLVFVPS